MIRGARNKLFRNQTVLCLAFLTFFSSISPAIVQASEEIQQEPPLEQNEIVIDAEVANNDVGAAASTSYGMTGSSDDPTTASTVSGSTKTSQLDSNGFSGALNYRYPINVPPGRNGLQPTLFLSYDSQSVEHHSIFGVGWAVSIPSIQRINREGSEKLFNSNVFNSSLSGELVPLGSGDYRAKIESGDYYDYSLNSNTWTVKDKFGTTFTFGESSSSRQDNPSDTTQIYKWMISEIRDLNDNYISFEYYKNDGQIYPDTITYTGHGSTDGVFEVTFSRESRDDAISQNKTGFEVTTNYRVSEITTTVNGSWVRKYELDYLSGDNNNHSLLDTITETGRDEVTASTTALPAVNFDYQTSSDALSQDTDWDIPLYLSGNNEDVGTRLVDLNGDGLTDIIRLQKTSSSPYYRRDIYINDGQEGWSEDTSNWTIPTDIYFSHSNGTTEGGQIFDVNGDQFPDLIFSQNGKTEKIYLHNGTNGWTLNTDWEFPIDLLSYVITDDSGVRIFDVNGDGLTDIVKIKKESSTPHTKEVYINDGTAESWTQDTSWTIPTDFFFASYTGTYENGKYADVNGDGLIDLLHRYWTGSSTMNKVYINTGSGWEYDSNWSIPLNLTGTSGEDTGIRLVDMNGDGLTDIVRMTYQCCWNFYRNVYLNTGEEWVEDTSWTLPSGIYFSYNGEDLGLKISDISGDGMADFLYRPSTNYTQNKTFIHHGSRANLLTKITTARGAESSVTYQSSAQLLDGSTILNPNLPFSLDVVSEIENDNGLGLLSTYTYSYENGDYYYSDEFDRQFAGFGKMTKTDSDGNQFITSFHQGNATNSSQGEYSDSAPKIGKIYLTEAFNSNDDVFSRTLHRWESYDLGDDADFVKLTQTIQMTYDGDTDHKDIAETFTYNNANGNITEKVQYGEVFASTNGTFTDTGSDKFTTSIEYAENSSLHILGLPKSETVINQSSNKVRESKTYYDSQNHGVVTKGNRTKEELWKTASTYVDLEWSYNTYGLLTQEKDPRNKTLNYEYDAYNLYPDLAKNHLNHEVEYTYDYSSGQITQSTDANNRVFQTLYDGLDRKIEEKQPDLASPSTSVTSATYTYTSQSIGNKIQETRYLDSSTAVDTYTYTDGFDRSIQIREEMETANTFAVRDMIYNDLEQLEKESLPYSSTGSSKTSPTTNTNLLTTYEYDPIGRITSVQNAAGTTSSTYDDWKLTINDANGNDKHLYKDAYGQLIQVEEEDASSTYTTEYEYNGNGKLTKITDALSNVRNFTYDGLGRRITAEDLHATSDSYFGSWSYTYDDAGNLTSLTDPKSQTINYTYDDLNRISSEDYTGQAGIEVSYTYDSCTEGVGKLCSVGNGSADIDYNYNALGGIADEAKTIDTVTYDTSYTYDRQGNLLVLTNEDNSQVKYSYNTAGQLEAIQRKESTDSNYLNLVDDFDYGPHGKNTFSSYENGTNTTTTYDATKLYRPSSKVTVINGGDEIQNLSYTFDPNGNITQIVDSSDTDTAKTINYAYDDLNRLTSSSVSNAANGDNYSRTYSYSAIGNIINKSDQDDYDYNGNIGTSYANPHAVTSIDTIDFTYDNNGNVLTITNGPTNTWDYNNRLSQSVVGSNTITYEYDHTGQRVNYNDGVKDLHSPSRYYNTDGTDTTKHIFAGNVLVATIEGSGASVDVYTQHTDHLTGSNGITDENGDKEQVLDYHPFGDIRVNEQASSFDEQRKFTGHEFDTDTGLTYMNARYYHSGIGRFMSQDPVSRDLPSELLNEPQELNTYSYTANNPIKYVDPDGKRLVISDSYGSNFTISVYQLVNELHPGTGLLKVEGGYEVKINGTKRIDGSNTFSSELITRIVDAQKTATIHKNEIDSTPTAEALFKNKWQNALGLPVNSKINFNPESLFIIQEFSNGEIVDAIIPNEITLSHELIHAMHILEGDLLHGNSLYSDLSGTNFSTGRKEELRTVGRLGHDNGKEITENKIRDERGMNLRNSYENY